MNERDKKIKELVKFIDEHLNTVENSQIYFELGDIIKNILTLLDEDEPCGTCGGKKVIDSGGQNPDGSWIDIPCPDCQKPHIPNTETETAANNYQTTIDMFITKCKQTELGINPDDVEHKRGINQILCHILESYSQLYETLKAYEENQKALEEENKKFIDMVDDLRHGLEQIGCHPDNPCYNDCLETADKLVRKTLDKMKAFKKGFYKKS